MFFERGNLFFSNVPMVLMNLGAFAKLFDRPVVEIVGKNSGFFAQLYDEVLIFEHFTESVVEH